MVLSTIQAKVRYLLGDISSDNYSDTNLNRSINDGIHHATSVAITSSGQWEVNGEIATTDLVASQKEYVFPTDLVRLTKIEVNTPNGTTTWDTANIKNEKMRTMSNFVTDSTGQNTVYLFDNSIFFEEAPGSAVTAGLKVWYSKESTELSSASDEPTLPEHLHMYLVYWACVEYSLRISDEKMINTYTNLQLKKENEIKEYYTNRLSTDRPGIRTRRENYN